MFDFAQAPYTFYFYTRNKFYQNPELKIWLKFNKYEELLVAAEYAGVVVDAGRFDIVTFGEAEIVFEDDEHKCLVALFNYIVSMRCNDIELVQGIRKMLREAVRV